MEKKRDFFLTLSGVLVAVAVTVVVIGVLKNRKVIPFPSVNPPTGSNSAISTPFEKLQKFKSEAEFKEYLETSSQAGAYGGFPLSTGAIMEKSVSRDAMGSVNMTVPGTAGGIPERVSQTNTQVFGIDEPDIVKTDGKNLYYSTPYFIYDYRERPVPLPMERNEVELKFEEQPVKDDVVIEPGMKYIPPRERQGGVISVAAFPPVNMSKLGALNVSGDLLLSGDALIVFNEQNYSKRSVDGYDVSNPASPSKKWSIPFKQNSAKVQARLYKNELYLITRVDMGGGSPCPIRPFDMKTDALVIPCTDIYRPSVNVGNDAVYTISKINASSGKINNTVTFIGSSSQNAVYMSRDAIYLTYHYSGDITKIMYLFVNENKELFDSSVAEKLSKLQGYDISQEAKMMELTRILGRFMNGMDEDKRLAFENNLQNRAKKFMAEHARELDATGIVKVNLNGLDVDATGSVPGQVLNQFSLDEYEGNLRIATTVAQNGWIGGFGQMTDSFSDVYVLDGNLTVRGSVKDLGKKERIYSVRFIADRGYVVTFRQTDPFYVLDLSSPSRPELKGELKIPGFSSYLHPLTTDIILGIGRDGGNVKLSLFDVSDPMSPNEVDNYQLSEYWSEALDNHHAFLADEKHNVFFMPGSKGGYVFSYTGNKISLTKAVSDVQVQRAIYINNYLYIIGQNNIVVLDEDSWTKAGELSL